MVYAFLFILCLFYNTVITFDEETLIILASMIWADAAGGLFKKLLEAELVYKIDLVHSKFIWFFALKRRFLLELLNLHSTRKRIRFNLVTVNNVFLSGLILESTSLYLFGASIRRKFNSRLNVVLGASFTQYARVVENLKKTTLISDFSEVIIKSAPACVSDLTLLGYNSTLDYCFV